MIGYTLKYKLGVLYNVIIAFMTPWMHMYDSIYERPCIYIDRKWQDYVYIQCEYKSTKQKIKHLLREENKVKENKI